MEYITLNNGVKMPLAGIGTFMLTPDEAEEAVIYALNNGYELVDTANAYQNEKAVGRAIKRANVSRDKVFLETKLWPSFYEEEGSVDKTIERLGVDYIDLMILHQPAGNYVAGYKQLEKAYKEGKLKAIGISNFNEDEIDHLLKECEIVPMLIQVEAHPYSQQRALTKKLAEHKIVLQAWYPLGGRGNNSIMDNPVVVELAAKHQKSPAQVILRWHTQMNYIVIPGSKTPAHISDNLNLFDFELSKEEMDQMAALDQMKPFYVRSAEAMAGFAMWKPDLDAQK